MGTIRRLYDRFNSWAKENRRLNAEKFRIHAEYHYKLDRLHRRHGRDREFMWYERHIRYTRPLTVIFNLIVWYLIFRYLGLRTISVAAAILLTIGAVGEFIFLMRLEKRVFIPINRLRIGMEEVSRGNYGVSVQSDVVNEIGELINSFNDMTRKLHEGEKVKGVYEENRKALIVNISHDLKTPITTIQGYIETMLERPDIPRETMAKYHQIIYNNAAYLNKLIDDLFLFSKLDMQKLDLNLETLDIRAFMGDLMEEFEFELEDKQIRFHYQDSMSEGCRVRIDRKRVNQIFRNIIGNAVKFGYKNYTMIRVKLYREAGFACIDIEDNGPGIPEDKLPHLFERFYRIDFPRTKDLMSTGLGLAIAKELAEAHGGRIKAASVEGIGTCFTVMLPIDTESEV